MADTKKSNDMQGSIPSLDGKAREWVDSMLPHVDRTRKPSSGSPPQNKPNDLHFTDITRGPQIAVPATAPPADMDPLTAAIKAKDSYKVQQYVTLLIVSGYHLGGPDSHGDIPIILAAKSNDYIITTMVMGPTPNPRDADGKTPLIIATLLGNAQSVEFLLKKKANPSLKDKAKKTALDYALQNQKAIPTNKDFAQIVSLLQDAEKKAAEPTTTP